MWPFGNKAKRTVHRLARMIRARFDAAVTNADNTRHWANADGLSADAAASADVRETLRNRARYEVANNSYAKGIVLTLANDCVGTGPRLQLLTEDTEINRLVETAFADWALETRLAEKLRTMRMAKATDGEAFGMLTVNPALLSPVKLDARLVEADRVTNPAMSLVDETAVDGIEFDRYGNPRRYLVLRQHPGQGSFASTVETFDRVPAEAMIHWFRPDRPGQHRGVPEITPALPLFAQLRRYTLAVLGAAETAADFAAVLFTDAPASGEAAAVEPMDIVELEKRMATVLPDGWKLGQIKAEQPGTTYGEFKRELLNEIARCLNMPFNIAAGNSSGYNYASGRLDHQTYFKAIRVEQADCNAAVLDRILAAWLAEARLLRPFAFLRGIDLLPHQWFWDGTEHVDPAKEASAQTQRLANHTTTLATEYARQGKDWETELRQRAKERELMDELGLSAPEAGPQDDTETDEEDDTDDRDERQAA
ncbi:MAG: phage portal protein [Planctomycetes bacterium]|nr:phage portal protein [Planctomycetota bacterium]